MLFPSRVSAFSSRLMALAPRLAALVLALSLGACAAAPESGDTVDNVALEPELELNLPAQEDAPCETVEASLLDRGFTELAAGRHVEAVTYFKRYREIEGSTAAAWEAQIAIAYDSMMPQSPFYDPEAAQAAYRDLQDSQPQAERLHNKTLMMRDALQAYSLLIERIEELSQDNAQLSETLAKREEAIKRLRELTLGP